MAMIPQGVYRTVEKKLRDRWTMLERAEGRLSRAKARATDISSHSGGGRGGGIASNGGRTQRGAMALIQAEKQMETAKRWLQVFQEIDRIFPDDTDEGFVAGLMYSNGMTQDEVCKATGCTRATIRRRQDRYIIRVAMLAAAEGLIEAKELSGE